MDCGNLNIVGKLSAGVDQKIYETTLGANTTAVTISGLDGDTDLVYHLIVKKQYGAAAASINTTLNNDTGTNYGLMKVHSYGSTIAGGGSTGDHSFYMGGSNAGESSLAELILFAKSGYARPGLVNMAARVSGTTVNYTYDNGVSWGNTADNITSIEITADAANGFGTGSYVCLYARRITG